MTRRQTTDGLGRLVRLEEQRLSSDGGSFPYVATYGYDHADRLVSVGLNENGGDAQQRSFFYSAGGFLTAAIEPERETTYLAHDALGNVRWDIVGGTTTTYVFDDFGRPTDAWVGPDPLRHLEYGTEGIGSSSYNKVVTAVQTNRFRAPMPVADVDVLHEWVYDGPGRRVSGRYTEVEGFGAPGDAFAISYDYDRWGNPRTTFFPEWMGCREDSSWAGAYRQWDGPWLTSVSLEASPTSRQQVASFGYLSTGRVGTINYANGLASWTETPDPNGMARPSQISLDLGSNGSLEWLHGPITYDGSGNITSIGQLGSPTARRFAYDGVGRLTGFQYSPEGFNEGYGYDRWGNMTSFTRNGATTTFTMQSIGGVPSTNRVQDVMVDRTRGPFAYDPRGNLTSLPDVLDGQRAKTFHYSTEDRLLQSTDDEDGFTWRYAYDTGGERVARWHRDGDDVDVELYVRDESGAVVSEWMYLPPGDGNPAFVLTLEYVNGPGGTLAQLDYRSGGETLSYLAADHLGSSRVMFDASGIVEQYDFVPFGGFAPWGDPDPDTTHLFTGHERDLGTTSSGLDYMHARYYSSGLGRFLSVDPVGGTVGSSQSWNRYSYVRNKPLHFIDPNGEDLYLVYDSSQSGLSARQQAEIKRQVFRKYRAAGVNRVYSFNRADRKIPLPSQLESNDRLVPINIRARDRSHGWEEDGTAFVEFDKSVVSGVETLIANMVGHEVGHGTHLLPQYDWHDQVTPYVKDGCGTVMQTGNNCGDPVTDAMLSTSQFGFDDDDSRDLRQGLNHPNEPSRSYSGEFQVVRRNGKFTFERVSVAPR